MSADDSRFADPGAYFGLPLWLRARCCGGRVLWAYNATHLDLLASFVGADLRERGRYGGCDRSLIERLPAWIKAAGHRAELLAAITRMRNSMESPTGDRY
ncbi:hypothetical protein FB565_008913 [Actinoplanes lutulentus]|uniref:Uncharacterized protein n=1 Tax=Actinoplanes lutulentus TaxID=1287878 RepID=A0A327Z6W0_9ACTN|nr:hypothetical protein [Actinoplanes lutulentus]MBB2949108.1 hypothetical protein [Actinoplanes lutulentus]RAK31429.1 hypothetical protein B0I29_115236 [Actinoplanes lutulentus]